jgi:hypothetical protein
MKIILPKDEDQKDYILFLFKNRNNFHKMNDKDINNLLKLINNGILNNEDFPIINKKNKIQQTHYNGYSFSHDFYSKI